MVPVGSNSSVLLTTFMFMVNQSYIQQEDSYNYYYMQIGKESNASKCYGSYGCFQLAPPWTSESRPVSLFPEDSSKIEPRFPVFTRSYPKIPGYIDLNEFNYIEYSGITFDTPLYLITHGYLESGKIYWIRDMAQSLLRQENCTVVVIDWAGGSGPPYTQAVANIRLIGVMVAHLIKDIAKFTRRKNLDDVHCIGHSLGAHLCGYIGYTLQKDFQLTLGRITGMDPADPHFSKTQPPVRLDRTAAKYVDVIHTDATQFIRGGLGMIESIGHVDYYPNGGTAQPGCTKSIVEFIRAENGSFISGAKHYLSCNHVRSHKLFLESITHNPKCKFMTISCPSYQEFISGGCLDCGKHGENCLKFGYHGRKRYDKLWAGRSQNVSRIQYLLTGEDSPFCKGHYRIAVQISENNASKVHGGEVGQLYFTMHSTSDGRGHKSTPIGFKSGFHEPGASYTGVVATDEVSDLRAIEIEWRYSSSFFNLLTWRIVNKPKVFLKKVTVESLELNKRLTVCPKDQKPLISGESQLMLSSYC